MQYLAFSGLFGFLTGIICALFVFFHRPQTPLKFIWSIFGLLVSAWSLGLFLVFTAHSAEVALYWARILNHVAIFIPVLLLHFVLLLTGRYEAKQKALIASYVLVVLYYALAILFPHYYIPSVSPKGVFAFYPDAGSLYYIFPFLFLGMVIYAMAVLYDSYRKASSARQNQYKYFFYSTLIGIFGSSTTFLPVFDVPIFPYGVIAAPLYNLLVAYIIVKHQLMDIRLVIRKSLIYTVLISIITLVYIVGVYLLQRLFQEALGFQSSVSAFTMLIVIAVFFIPLKSFVESFIEKYLFRASYLQMAKQNDYLRQEVLRAERLKTLAQMSQKLIIELRNPLTALVGYGHQLPRRLNDPTFLQKFVLVFDKEIKRINTVVEQLGEFSQPKTLEVHDENIVEIMSQIVERVTPKAQSLNVTLYKYFDENQKIILPLDAQAIRQALRDILVFSLKTMPDGGQLWVGIDVLESMVELSIKDTGKGFHKEDLVKLFDPLFSSEEDEISLSATQAAIQNHGGKILVESEEGVGTEFVVQLPALMR